MVYRRETWRLWSPSLIAQEQGESLRKLETVSKAGQCRGKGGGLPPHSSQWHNLGWSKGFSMYTGVTSLTTEVQPPLGWNKVSAQPCTTMQPNYLGQGGRIPAPTETTEATGRIRTCSSDRVNRADILSPP